MIVCGALAFTAFLTGQVAMAVLMLALLGSVTGFLFFNFYPAKIFMGDCGSMFLGFMIGAGSVVCQTKTHTLVGLAVPFLAMGVPILDTGFAIIRRRFFDRRSIFAADRKHLHHLLLDLGLHQRTVVIAMYAVTAISASIGVFMLTVSGGWAIALLAVGLFLLFALFACLNGGQFCGMVDALKRNRTIAHEGKLVRRAFEETQTKMRNATDFSQWWESLCEMTDQMHFHSIGLWVRSEADDVNVCQWSAKAGKFATRKTAEFRLPVSRGGDDQWEIRAQVWVNGCLEIGGHETMLLARLMDEFPPLDLIRPAGADMSARESERESRQTEERYSDNLEYEDFGRLGNYSHAG